MHLKALCQLIWSFLKLKYLKIIKSGGFLGSLLSKIAGLFIKVAISLAKNILAPLRITAAASQIDVGIQKKKQKKKTWFWNNNSIHFKWRNE